MNPYTLAVQFKEAKRLMFLKHQAKCKKTQKCNRFSVIKVVLRTILHLPQNSFTRQILYA